MKRGSLRLAAIVGALMISSSAYAADCKTSTPKDDLTDAEVQKLYDCILEKMRTGYAKGGNAWAKDYTGWKATATLPAAPGPHGNRFLMTFVNDTGHAEYVKFLEERGPMPVGTIIAKESFNIHKKKGTVRVGPLFFMEKVAAGNADKFGNWVYSAVRPNGKPMKVKQKFCHDCHSGFEDQDALGYPDEDYRISSN
ncbi:MAG: cytochrome P460 family protein [Pseudomonadota bacterium]